MNNQWKAPSGMRTFKVYRGNDESGVSGTGLVHEGVLFSTGVTIIHWLTPPPRGSVNVFDSFDQYMAIHVGQHPTNETVIEFDNGHIINQGEWVQNYLPTHPQEA